MQPSPSGSPKPSSCARDDDPPVLLLDDIVSELDAKRRDSVLAGLAGFDQVWFTAITGSWLPEAFLTNTQTFTVENGTVSPNSP
jgi:recombinational DNA repair ATPase RecF